MKQISLGELALELGVNKSKLAYYHKMGLLKPESVVGKMQIFDANKVRKVVERIEKYKDMGNTLKEIKELI